MCALQIYAWTGLIQNIIEWQETFFFNLTLFEPFWNKKKHLHHPKINPQTKNADDPLRNTSY